LVDRAAADGVAAHREVVAEALGDAAEHALGLGDDFGADPVAGQQDDLSVHEWCCLTSGVRICRHCTHRLQHDPARGPLSSSSGVRLEYGVKSNPVSTESRLVPERLVRWGMCRWKSLPEPVCPGALANTQ